MGTTKTLRTLSPALLGVAALLLLSMAQPSRAAETNRSGAKAQSKAQYFALPLPSGQSQAQAPAKPISRYGVPFILTTGPAPAAGSTLHLDVGSQVKRIFFLGMTESAGVRAWMDPRDDSQRYYVGDRLGRIRLNYADGSTEDFPLILGESVWWGKIFEQYREPFPTDAALRKALARSLHLYPAAPVEDGNYVAVIVPRAASLRSIEIENSAEKKGSVAIVGITAETASDVIAGATRLTRGQFLPVFTRFTEMEPLRASGSDESQAQERLNDLRHALYTSDEELAQPVATRIPPDYSGPSVSFKGTRYASILENAFYANIDDMLAKIDADGMYHTSTFGAVSWHGAGFGSYRSDVGLYYRDSWSRDLGRSLQELTELGYLNQATQTGDYVMRSARLWAENPSLKYHGERLPPHWSRVINRPDTSLPFENDGHGLISMFLYKLWQRTPDRDAWLRSHWADVKAAGDWIPWQFDHADISGAKDGVLHTTGESAAGNGYSVYPDVLCMTALRALAQMADSIGETQSAALWRDRAEKMQAAIPAKYLINDPKYGKVWTLDFAGWPNKSTVLGPLIVSADYKGFAPADEDAAWKSADEAAYQRLIDSYKPFGFYGQAMGYGQGFVTQSALLLDRMHDATTMLDWTAKQIYDPRFGSFIVPEGVQVDPTGKFWYRTGDLGNGVQEAEIIKALRIVIGVDDTEPQRLRIFPRLPYGWSEMSVDQYPALVEEQGKVETAHVRYRVERAAGHMDMQVSADRQLGPVAMRLGPFEKQPQLSDVLVNGKHPKGASIAKSGDSWWVSFTASVGTASTAAQR